MVRYVVLGLLRDGRPRHGYAIMREYREAMGAAPSLANIYRELHSLLTLGWVRPAVNPPEADARRVPYTIAPLGVKALHDWIAAPGGSPFTGYADGVSLRAFVVGHVGTDLPARVVARWREELSAQRQVLRHERDALVRRRKSSTTGNALTKVVLERRLRQVSTDLDFVEQLGATATVQSTNGPVVLGGVGPIVAARTL